MQHIDAVEKQRDCALDDRGLKAMPVEILSMICTHVRRPRDLAALVMAASHLIAEPLAVYVGRLVEPERLSCIVAAGAPLSAVKYLFGHWRVPPAVHMLGDAAAGGRLDVVKWLYTQLTGYRAERHIDEDDTDSCEYGGTGGCRFSTRKGPVRYPTLRARYPTQSMHARRICTKDSSCSSCTDSSTDLSDTDLSDAGNGKPDRFAVCDTIQTDDSSSDSDSVDVSRHTQLEPAGATMPAAPIRPRLVALSSRRPAVTTLACVQRHDAHVARPCVSSCMADVVMRAVRNGRTDVVQWLLDVPCSRSISDQPHPSDFERFKIEAASRGNVPMLVILCGHRRMRSEEVALAALQADQINVVEWIASKRLLGKPKMTPTFVGDLIASGHRPRFVQWAAARDYRADPTSLIALVERDDVGTLSLVHDTGVCVCTPEIVRAAARAGSISVLKWAAGDDHATPRVGAAWRPTDVAMLAATNRHRHVIAWLHTRSDGRRALTAGVARAALAAGCVDVAAQIRPLGTWDAMEAAVASCDTDVVRDVADAGGVCSPAAFASTLRLGATEVLALLCERYGVGFLEIALASLAGVECAPECIEWVATNPTTSHLCVAEAFAAILAKGEVDLAGACRCAACAGVLP